MLYSSRLLFVCIIDFSLRSAFPVTSKTACIILYMTFNLSSIFRSLNSFFSSTSLPPNKYATVTL